MKTWPEPKSIKDIQIFLSFTNFYKRFIKNFGKKYNITNLNALNNY